MLKLSENKNKNIIKDKIANIKKNIIKSNKFIDTYITKSQKKSLQNYKLSSYHINCLINNNIIDCLPNSYYVRHNSNYNFTHEMLNKLMLNTKNYNTSREDLLNILNIFNSKKIPITNLNIPIYRGQFIKDVYNYSKNDILQLDIINSFSLNKNIAYDFMMYNDNSRNPVIIKIINPVKIPYIFLEYNKRDLTTYRLLYGESEFLLPPGIQLKIKNIKKINKTNIEINKKYNNDNFLENKFNNNNINSIFLNKNIKYYHLFTCEYIDNMSYKDNIEKLLHLFQF
jgi:hypothetical protein